MRILCGLGSSVGIATGYGLDGPGIESRWGARFSAPVQTSPVAHPASCTVGTGSFPGVNCGRGVTLTPHTLLVPWSRKSRAMPLIPLWAVRPVQSLSACTRVHFTLYLYENPVRVCAALQQKELRTVSHLRLIFSCSVSDMRHNPLYSVGSCSYIQH